MKRSLKGPAGVQPRDDVVLAWPSHLSDADCCLRYYWSHIKHYKPKRRRDSYTLGLGIHAGLEGYYGADLDPVEEFQSWMDDNTITISGIDRDGPNLRELGTVMLRNYQEEYLDEELEVLATEKELARRIPIPPDDRHPPSIPDPYYIAARLDGIVRTPDGKVWVFEHKTYNRFYPDSLVNNPQFILENYVAKGFFGTRLAGVLYNGLWKRTEPTRSQPKLFQRHYVPVSDHQEKVFLHSLYWQLRYIRSPLFKVYPQPSPLKCRLCPYQTPCKMYLSGEDYKTTLESMFEIRETDHDVTYDDLKRRRMYGGS